MENREIRKEVHALAWPMVVTNFMTRGIDIVAMILVGHLGKNALAGLGIGLAIFGRLYWRYRKRAWPEN